MPLPDNDAKLSTLKNTRTPPKAGDIFVFQLNSTPDKYFFGRVIATDTKIGGVRDFEAVLVYLYRTTSFSKMDIPPLHPSDLLVPPIGTNTRPWVKGFFEKVASKSITTADLLPQHCFRDVRGWLYDEYENRLLDPTEPIGEWGVAGIGAIECDINRALNSLDRSD